MSSVGGALCAGNSSKKSSTRSAFGAILCARCGVMSNVFMLGGMRRFFELASSHTAAVSYSAAQPGRRSSAPLPPTPCSVTMARSTCCVFLEARGARLFDIRSRPSAENWQ
jgi:hypothetical protein